MTLQKPNFTIVVLGFSAIFLLTGFALLHEGPFQSGNPVNSKGPRVKIFYSGEVIGYLEPCG